MTLPPRTRILIGAAALAFITVDSVLPAMRSVESDFSNYYLPSRLLARGMPTNDLYEFSWFQRQMDYAGIEAQSGGFNRFPPPSGIVMWPLGFLPPLAAKRAWTLVNLAALVTLVVVLARLGGLPVHQGLLLAAVSGTAVRNNFLFGQFYIVLALLLAAGFWLREKGRALPAGVLFGVGAAIKLYPAPLALYFALRREWGAVTGFALGAAGAFALSTLAFGWDLNAYFFTGVLGPSLAALTDDPFHPALQSVTSLLRRILVAEPTLNPTPLVSSPFLFFFLKNLFALGVVGVFFWALRKRKDATSESMLLVALLLVSTTLLSYHFVLALVPVSLWVHRWIREERFGAAAIALGLFVLAGSSAVSWQPSLQLRLLALAGVALVMLNELRPLALPRFGIAAVVATALVLATTGSLDRGDDGSKPVAWAGARSESPAPRADGVTYSMLSRDRYVLSDEAVGVRANVFAPAYASGSGALFFETTEGRRSRVIAFRAGRFHDWTPDGMSCGFPAPSSDGSRMVAACAGDLYLFTADARFASPSVRRLTATAWEEADPALSPDGKRLAFASRRDGGLRLFELSLETGALRPLTAGDRYERGPSYSPDGRHLTLSRRLGGQWDVFLLDPVTGRETRLTDDSGNDTEPAFSTDGRRLYFASDRGRGIFMPAIYALDIEGEL